MTEFLINVTCDGKSADYNIGEWEEFPEAATMAEHYLKENNIKDYSINSLKAVSGEYEGKMVKGEDINSLFITKDEILEGLQDETIGIGFQDGSITAYMADNYFYFDSDFIDEIPEDYHLTDSEIADIYLKEHSSYTIAEKIHECLEDFITEFPMEYWSYKLCLTNDNNDKTIKIETIKQLYVDFGTSSTDLNYDVEADAVDSNGNKYTVFWNYADPEENPDAYAGYSGNYPVYDDHAPALILNDKGEDVTSQCEICYLGDDYKKYLTREKSIETIR